MSKKTKLQGVEELEAKLKGLNTLIVGSRLELAVKAGAQKIVNAAKQKVPVRSGTLKRSINIETTKQEDTFVEVAIGPNTPYAARIEFGYDGKTDKRGRTYHQQARPYLRPAFDEQVDAAKDTIKKRFVTLINKAAKGEY